VFRVGSWVGLVATAAHKYTTPAHNTNTALTYIRATTTHVLLFGYWLVLLLFSWQPVVVALLCFSWLLAIVVASLFCLWWPLLSLPMPMHVHAHVLQLLCCFAAATTALAFEAVFVVAVGCTAAASWGFTTAASRGVQHVGGCSC
jgi:hypothetical protein